MTAVWVVGTPISVLWTMRHHGVPGMVDKKTRQAVVSQMIDRYVANSVGSSQRKLANSIGKRVTELGDCTGEKEFEHRSADLYQTIFPDHAECRGGVFPKLVAAILKRILSFTGASGTKLTLGDFKSGIDKWFEDADIDLNDFLDQQELRREFQQLGLGDDEADAVLQHFDFDDNTKLDKTEFEAGMLHILDSSIPGLRFSDVLALFLSLPEVADNIPVSLERFQEYSKGLCLEALIFTGAERADTLSGQQLLALLGHQWKRYQLDMGDGEVDEKIEAEECS